MRILSLLLAIVMAISGCAREYEANMKARENMALYQFKYQQQAVDSVMSAVKVLIKPLEIQWSYKNTDKPICDDGSNAMLTAMREMLRWHGMAELERARAQAIQYLTPIIQAIYAQHLQNFGTPMSTNELLARVANNIPLMTTVAGMYGLGVSAARYAGDQVNASLESGASMNVKGQQVFGGITTGNENAVTASPNTTRYTVSGDPAPGGVNEIEFNQQELPPSEE